MSKIILMGDSITEYMPYIFKGKIGCPEDEVQYRGIENIGVGRYMKYVWPNVLKANADVYILLIGINNILRPDCDDDEKETLDDIIDKLKEFINVIINNGSPRLIVQSIYPTKYLNSNTKVIYVNEALKNYCQILGIEYLDLYNVLQDDDGLFNKKYSNDGIHPNEEGYKLIAKEINNRLNVNIVKKLSRSKQNIKL